MTPKGMFETKNVSGIVADFVSNYKGGRNESFMYGIDREIYWYDYDLTSAYTTVMSGLGHPSYSMAKNLSPENLEKMYREAPLELLNSYSIIKGSFEFPGDVKYPSIPVFLDETTTVYPLQGDCILTGSEYLTARSQGCEIKAQSFLYVPFHDKNDFSKYPFRNLMKQIQSERRKYPKNSVNNLMYKEIGNSIYGIVVRGISHKTRYDIKTGSMKRMDGTKYSNPLLAS
jgi:hypothetical protein